MRWRPIKTAPKSSLPIIVALIRRGKVWWVEDAVWNGLGWYGINGASFGTSTHWIPMPEKTPINDCEECGGLGRITFTADEDIDCPKCKNVMESV